MSPTRRLAHAAARRRLLQALLTSLGPSLTIAAGAALLAIVADRLIGLSPPDWALLAAPLALAAAISVIIALRRRPSPLAAAAEVDSALALHDRLSSAIDLTARAPDDPFVRLAAIDADRAASNVRLRDAIPLRIGRSWIAWPLLLAACIAGAIYLPSLDLLSRRAASQALARQAAEREDAAEEIQQAREAAARAAAAEDPALADLATPEELKVLDRIEQQLTSGSATPDEARSNAAGALEQLADSLENRAEDSRRAADALADRFSGLAPPEDSAGPGGELADALRRGDSESARRALEQISRGLAGMDEAERRRIAEELRRLGENVDAAAEAEDPSGSFDDARPDPLQQQGLTPEDGERLRDNPHRDAVRDELLRRGAPPEVAERLADQNQEEQRDRRADEESRRDAQELGESLREAADEAQQPPPPPPATSPDAPAVPPAGQQAPPPPEPPKPPEPRPDQPPSDHRGEPDRQAQSREQPQGGEQRTPGQQQQQGRDAGASSRESPPGQAGDRDSRQGESQGAPKETPKSPPEPSREEGASKSDSTTKPDGGETARRPDAKPTGRPDQGQDQGAAPTSTAPQQSPEATPDARSQPQQREPGGQSPGQREIGKQSPDDGAKGAEKPDDAKGAQKPDGAQGAEKPGSAQRSSPEPDAAAPKTGSAPNPDAASKENDQSDAEPGADEKQPGADPGPEDGKPSPPDSRGFERAMKKLEELARDKDAAKDAQRDAERLRERAKELLDQMSPEQRERMERWAEQMAQEQGAPEGPGEAPEPGADRAGAPDGRRTVGTDAAGAGPGRPRPVDAHDPAPRSTETVDARRAGDRERVIAEWFDPEVREGADPGVSRRAAEQRIRQAAESAERAVEDQSIPQRRSDLVRRYFRRLPEVVRRDAPPGPAPRPALGPRAGPARARGASGEPAPIRASDCGLPRP